MSGAPASYKRILLTGGTGFVGGWLAPALAEAWPNAERLLVRRPGERVSHSGWSNADAEITDAAAIDSIVAGFRPDLVLHLAAQASVGAGLKDAEATWRINFCGSLELATSCARYAPDTTFFFVSSSEVYGWSFREGPATEETALRPVSSYAHAKAAAEAMLTDVLPQTARLVIVRPFNHTGPGQSPGNFVLSSFAAQIAAIEQGRQTPELHVGNLDAERDFLHVGDVCAAYIGLLRAAPALPRGGVYNVASGARYRIGDLVEKFRAVSRVPFEPRVDAGRLRPSDIPLAIGSAEKLSAATGWRPAIAIDEILGSLLDYWRRQGAPSS
ncbi:MAG: GDP-mannose 4,6-dehydratase [Beijerinckiaceae bacterium]